MRRSVTCALLLLACSGTLRGEAAQSHEVVEVEAEVFGLGKTPEEARREALQRAREMAVAAVGGVHVAAHQTRLKSEHPDNVIDSFASLIATSTQGRIVHEVVSYRTELVDDIPVYKARLRAEVVLERGRPDPGFTLEISSDPDSPVLRDGERIEIEVTASRSCYLTLLNVTADGQVAVIFPARRDVDNRLEGGQIWRWPSANAGVDLEVRLSAGKDRDHEQILAIATRDPVPFVLGGAGPNGEARLVADHETTLAALNRWLVGIPVSMRAEALLGYEIVE